MVISKEQCVKNLVEGVFDGKSAAVMCYGQTGSGKTHTMLGELEGIVDNVDLTQFLQLNSLGQGAGIAPRLMTDLFAQARTISGEVTIDCSFLEIYCETVRDLLKEHMDEKQKLTRAGKTKKGKDKTHKDKMKNIADSSTRKSIKNSLDIMGGSKSSIFVQVMNFLFFFRGGGGGGWVAGGWLADSWLSTLIACTR